MSIFSLLAFPLRTFPSGNEELFRGERSKEDRFKEEHSTGRSSTRLEGPLLLVAALFALAFLAAGCSGAGVNEENGGGDDGGGDNGGDGTGLSAPAAPSGLETAVGGGSVQLSWDGADGADTYRVYRGTSSGVDTSSSALEAGVGQTSYTDESAESGTEYVYAVSAVASGGGENAESGASGEVSVVPVASLNGLEAIPQDEAAELTWDAVGGADTYRIYRSRSSGVDPSGSPLETGVEQNGYTDEGVGNGTEYYYRVTPVNSNGTEGDPSGEASVVPFSSPGGLEGTSGDSQVELSWEAAAGAETYNVYRSTSSTGGAEGNPLATGVSGPSYTDESAENGTKYYYRVTSVNPSGAESSASSEIEKTPFSEPPSQP